MRCSGWTRECICLRRGKKSTYLVRETCAKLARHRLFGFRDDVLVEFLHPLMKNMLHTVSNQLPRLGVENTWSPSLIDIYIWLYTRVLCLYHDIAHKTSVFWSLTKRTTTFLNE